MLRRICMLATVAVIIATLMSGCNAVTRKFGGTQTVKLEHGQKLVNATWKENSLWLLTRDMQSDEKPESYKFKENSNFGVLEGTVNIIESK